MIEDDLHSFSLSEILRAEIHLDVAVGWHSSNASLIRGYLREPIETPSHPK